MQNEVVRVVLMAAVNTPDGNPQRCYVGYDTKGNVVGTVDYYKEQSVSWLVDWLHENGSPIEQRVRVDVYETWLRLGDMS